jgi:protein O-mannosyl-transferase
MAKQFLKSSAKKPLISKGNNKYFKQFVLFAILAITAIVYSNSFNNGFVKYDDDYYVTDNKYIRDFSFHGIKEIACSYVKDELPVTLFSFAIDYKLWKLNPKPYHIENLLLHLINITLVFFLIMLVFNNFNIALIVTLLFAFHPFRVESVAWIAERKDLLYSLFLLTSLICYIRYLNSDNYKFLMYILALILSVLSVFSKFSGVTIAFIFILLDYYFKRKFSFLTIVEKIPFLIIPFISLIIHFTYKPVFLNQMQESIFNYTIVDRTFLACYSLLFYIFGLFAPFGLSVIHSYPFKDDGALPLIYYLSPVILILIIYLTVLLVKRISQFKRELIFSILFFIITISIYLHIVPYGGNVVVAERYTYISYLGLFVFIAHVYLWIVIYSSKSVQRFKSTILTFGYLSLIYFLISTYSRNNVWKNTYTLFTDVIENDSKVPLAYNNRGGALVLANNFKDAITDFNKAIEINPKYSDAYCNRSVAKLLSKDGKGAIEDLDMALYLNKNSDKAYCNRGHAKTVMKDYAGAAKDLDFAIKLNPESYEAWYNKGVLNYEQKKINEALQDYNKSLIINPSYSKSYINRGNIKGEFKDFNGAIKDYNKALEFNSENSSAYLNRGIARYYINDHSGACADWKSALQKGEEEGGNLLREFCR